MQLARFLNKLFKEDGFITCGTHLHVSYLKQLPLSRINMRLFSKYFNNKWVKSYQDNFIKKYYIWQNRYKNYWCLPNKIDEYRNRPNLINFLNVDSRRKIFHLEFRGFGEIIGNKNTSLYINEKYCISR